jgi:hypothetical protein
MSGRLGMWSQGPGFCLIKAEVWAFYIIENLTNHPPQNNANFKQNNLKRVLETKTPNNQP